MGIKMIKRSKISQRKKSLILSEAVKPGSVISSLAKLHGVAEGTIYKWLKHKKQSESSTTDRKLPKSLVTPHFVEVAVLNANKHNNSSDSGDSSCGNSALQKASFVFSTFSVSFDGTFKSEVIVKIINALDESIC